MPKKSKKRLVRDFNTPDEKAYEIREIDYLAYNTLFSIQQLLNTLNLLAEQQRDTIRILSRIEHKLDEYLIPEEENSGNKSIEEEGSEGGSGEDPPPGAG